MMRVMVTAAVKHTRDETKANVIERVLLWIEMLRCQSVIGAVLAHILQYGIL